MLAVAFIIATLPLSDSKGLALHIQPRPRDHWMESDAGLLEDNTEATDHFSTTPGYEATEMTVIPTTTDTTLETDTMLPRIDAAPKSADLPWDIDVDSLLINIPGPFCPQGYRADLRGKCRQRFEIPMLREGYGRMLPPLLGSFIRPSRPRGNTLS